MPVTREVIQVTSDPAVVEDLASFVDDFCRRHSLDDGVRFKMQLVTEELSTNTMRHGYGRTDGWVRLSLDRSGDDVVIILEDAAPPFDPTREAPQPQVDTDLQEREIGGLGVFLVTELAESVEYSRNATGNCVRVVLNATATSEA